MEEMMMEDNFYRCGNCKKFPQCKANMKAQPNDFICDDFEPKDALMIKIPNNGILFIRKINKKQVRIWLDIKEFENTAYTNIMKVESFERDRDRKTIANKIANILEADPKIIKYELDKVITEGKLKRLPIPNQDKEVYISISRKIFDDRKIAIEIIHDGEAKFLLKNGDYIEVANEIKQGNIIFIPIKDDLIAKKKIYLPSELEEYENATKLYEEIKQFLRKYVEIDPIFEDLAVMYIFLTYFHDKCPVLPIFNIRGRSGTGKTRLATLMTMLSFYGMRASGALSFSSLFRYADKWRGTIFINEGDVRNPDVITYLLERPEKEGVVWRTNKETMKPEAFEAFGPTIITTRETFSDDALEDRCLVCLMNEKIRNDIPLNLPPEAEKEAEHLRNKLLKFYLDHYNKFENDYSLEFDGINLRLQQILQPMLSLSKIVSPTFYDKIKEIIEELNERIVKDRANSLDGRIIRAYFKLKIDGTEKITSKEIANFMLENWGIKVNPISIGKRMAAMNFRTERLSNKERERVKVIDVERMKILAKKYLPKEERDEFFEWLKQQTQERIDKYADSPLYSINMSEMSDLSKPREEISDKSKNNLSENFTDKADKLDKLDIYSEYTAIAGFKTIKSNDVEWAYHKLQAHKGMPKGFFVKAFLEERGNGYMVDEIEELYEMLIKRLEEENEE